MQRNLSILYALPFFLLFTACLKDYESVEVEDWNPKVAIPVLNTNLNIENLLDNFETGGFVNVDEDKFITLVYQSEVFSYQGEDVVSIPDINLPLPDSAITIPYEQLAFGYTIDEFNIKSGTFSYSFESPYEEDLVVKIIIPNLNRNNELLELEIPVDYTGETPVRQEGNIDLKDYDFEFYSQELSLKYEAMVVATNERVLLDNVNLSFSSLEYNHIIGQFATQELELPSDKIKIDLFKNSVGGSIYFEEPVIKLAFDNSFGVPVSLTAKSLEVMTENEEMMPVNSVLDDGVSFNYPSLNELGTSKMTNVVLDKDNSNLSDIIASNPRELDYEFSAILNPDAANPVKGFIEDASAIKVNVDVELPLWVRGGGNFITEKSIDFDASIFEDIVEAEFKLIATNGLPVDAGIQLYFEDDNGVVQDSLLQNFQNFLVAANVDSEGRVINNTENTIFIDLDEDRISNFRKATKIRLNALVTTEDIEQNSVRFYSDYGVTLQLGLMAVVKK